MTVVTTIVDLTITFRRIVATRKWLLNLDVELDNSWSHYVV